jgi:hypothetical protein
MEVRDQVYVPATLAQRKEISETFKERGWEIGEIRMLRRRKKCFTLPGMESRFIGRLAIAWLLC